MSLAHKLEKRISMRLNPYWEQALDNFQLQTGITGRNALVQHAMRTGIPTSCFPLKDPPPPPVTVIAPKKKRRSGAQDRRRRRERGKRS